jgi:hypothetical protein
MSTHDFNKPPLFSIINRSNASVYLAFSSLILFYMRVRGGNFDTLIFIVENSLFCLSVAIFPWPKKTVRMVSYLFCGLAAFSAITTFIHYNTPHDWENSFMLLSATIKCILVAFLFGSFDCRKVFYALKNSLLIIFAYQITWYFLFGRNIDLGFSVGMGDRNYYALSGVFLIYSLHLLYKKLNIDNKLDLLQVNVLTIALFMLIVLSGSRTGILSISFVILLFYGWRAIVIISILLIISYFFGHLDQLIYRVHNEMILPGRNMDAIRVAQYHAFLNVFSSNPVAAIIGFGPMASSHLDWFAQFYRGYDLKTYLYIQHNSILDFIISYGVFGIYVIWRYAKKLNWQILLFVFLTASFNNILIFFPFYVFIGVLLCLDTFRSQCYSARNNV